MSLKFVEIMDGKNTPPWDDLECGLYGFDDKDPCFIALLEIKSIYNAVKDRKENIFKVYEQMCLAIDQGKSFEDRLKLSDKGRNILSSQQIARNVVLGNSGGGVFRRRTEEQILQKNKEDFNDFISFEIKDFLKKEEKELMRLWLLYKDKCITKNELIKSIFNMIQI